MDEDAGEGCFKQRGVQWDVWCLGIITNVDIRGAWSTLSSLHGEEWESPDETQTSGCHGAKSMQQGPLQQRSEGQPEGVRQEAVTSTHGG